jgi:hypothetical protein
MTSFLSFIVSNARVVQFPRSDLYSPPSPFLMHEGFYHHQYIVQCFAQTTLLIFQLTTNLHYEIVSILPLFIRCSSPNHTLQTQNICIKYPKPAKICFSAKKKQESFPLPQRKLNMNNMFQWKKQSCVS